MTFSGLTSTVTQEDVDQRRLEEDDDAVSLGLMDKKAVGALTVIIERLEHRSRAWKGLFGLNNNTKQFSRMFVR